MALTTDGKAEAARHGVIRDDVVTISALEIDPKKVLEIEVTEISYELLSDEDFEIEQK